VDDPHEPLLPPEPSWVKDDDNDDDRTLAKNWLFCLRRERFRSRKSGKVHEYYVTHLADGVHAIAVTGERQVVMVRQFRAGSGRDSFETPGGLLEPGEDPRAAGARELLEETGYAGDLAEVLGTVWPNPALLTMKITTIVIRNARRIAAPQPDPSEELTVELVPVAEIPKFIKTGRIDHAACVAGLLWWISVDGAGAPPRPA
jgi:8-oxo-dGTP pyrophosphatase MutT (NUDIX family)